MLNGDVFNVKSLSKRLHTEIQTIQNDRDATSSACDLVYGFSNINFDEGNFISYVTLRMIFATFI